MVFLKQHRCSLDIYLMTVLSTFYGIIIDCAINERYHGTNAVDELNAPEKCSLKQQKELIGAWESIDTSNIEILPSASKHISIKLVDQCIHILNNKERLNSLKG